MPYSLDNFLEMAAVPPADQPVQQIEAAPRLQLQEGSIQSCSGYLKRRTTILKRWKKGWISVDPGKCSPLASSSSR